MTEREEVTVGMVTAALAAVGEHNVSLASRRRREVTKMIQAALDWRAQRRADGEAVGQGGSVMLDIAQRAAILQRQIDGWDRAMEAGRKGNPFATLCFHCYGRHAPPHDEICPHEPPPSARNAGQSAETPKTAPNHKLLPDKD